MSDCERLRSFLAGWSEAEVCLCRLLLQVPESAWRLVIEQRLEAATRDLAIEGSARG